MGIDLKVLPFDADNGICFSHTILNCEHRRELWAAIEPIEKIYGYQVPEGFSTYLGHDEQTGDTRYGETLKTPYGSPLKYVRAKHLLTLSEHESVTDNHLNRAVWAYLAQLPDDTKVALYWC